MDHKPHRPKVGVLALTLELYEKLAPELREKRELWLRRAVLPAVQECAETVFETAVYRREDVDSAVQRLESAGVDALLVLLLTYAPSQIALNALKRTRLPILIWNTQELFSVEPAFDRAAMTGNHGVHGTQDLSNVLRRSGVKFEYLTSHLNDPDGTRALADFLAAAAAVRRLRHARLGLLGYPFPGMGDFGYDTTHLAATLGCEWVNLPLEDYINRAAMASTHAVSDLVARYRELYDVAADLTRVDLEATARVELALRGMVTTQRLNGLSYQFMAFGEDIRTPTVPFVAASRLMAEGVGFGGEGDLISAAGTCLLNWLNPPATFSEMFTIDFGGNGVLMSHMGESNAAMARRGRKVALVVRKKPITRTLERQLVLTAGLEPGPATLCVLTLGAGQRWRLIASQVTIADFGPLQNLDAPHCKLIPGQDVRTFLTAYAEAGGPHHLALCFGDARARVKYAARLLDADYCEV